jgi:outer membrane receptor protein involved in Fe transport
MAQDEGADEEVEQVVVTGSRIVRKDLQAASPVTILNAEEITYTGTTRIEDLIASLPQAFVGQNSTSANGASGTATVNLRNLGTSRTLVLINGRRTAAGDPFSDASDLNFIPSLLVKRIDVLTGGASSVYGADAVAGVVNFILDTDFEGLKINAQYGFYQHNNRNKIAQALNDAMDFNPPKGNITDGHQRTLSMAAGSNFADGRGHASAYLTYRDIKSVTKANRDYTNCTINTSSAGVLSCGGSSTSAFGRFSVQEIDYDGDGNMIFGYDVVDGVVVPDLMDDGSPETSTKRYVLDWDTGNTFKLRTNEVFNYGPWNHLQRPDTRFSGGAFVNYQVNDNIEAYVETMFMDDYTKAQIAPSGNFGRTTTTNCDNPMFSAQQFQIICVDSGAARNGDGSLYTGTQADYTGTDTARLQINRRNFEGGNRTNEIRHTNYRIVAGFKGQIDDTWNYDIYGLRAQNLASETYINDLNVARLTQALLVEDDGAGGMQCQSSSARADGCVPWNIYTKGAVTDEALNYIKTIAVMNGWTISNIVSGSVVGNLGDYGVTTPWADEGVQLAMGAEYRSESMVSLPDEVYNKGLRAGGGSNTVAYDVGFNVKDLFAEAVIPLVQGAEMAEDLTLELAARYSEYNTSGGTTTFKIAGTWTPVSDIKFRGGFNRAVRTPGLRSIYAPQQHGLAGSNDGCAVDNVGDVPEWTLEQCLRTGATAVQYAKGISGNPANQYQGLYGGNPNLKPETADTITLGAVYTPESIPGFSLTVDYYKIELKGAIGSLGFNSILKGCADTGAEALCKLIHRDPQNGDLWEVSGASWIEVGVANIGKMTAEGIDVNLQYSMPVGDFGDLNLSMIGTYLLKDSYQDVENNYNCVGYFGCGNTSAKWKSKTRITWATNFNTDISLAWRFSSLVSHSGFSLNEDLMSSPSAQNARIVAGTDHIPASSYFDIAVSHNVTESIKASLGINNFLDKEPPTFGISSTGISGMYDPLGRYIFMSLKANF